MTTWILMGVLALSVAALMAMVLARMAAQSDRRIEAMHRAREAERER